MPRRLYLAYGANLNVDAMRYRCPRAVPCGPILLHGWRLVFRGVADIVEDPASTLAAGMWSVTLACEAALDRFEGVARRLYRREFIPVPYGERTRNALVYQMNARDVAPPSEHYLNIIREGYHEFGLPADILDRAVARALRERTLSLVQ